MASHTVTTVWKENMQFETDNPSGHKVFIDVGEENGGKGDGLRPKAMMLSALAGCSGVDVIPLLEKMRISVDDFKIERIGKNIHVLNAPSPAATSSLSIADRICKMIQEEN